MNKFLYSNSIPISQRLFERGYDREDVSAGATRLTHSPQIRGKFCVRAITSVTEVFFLSLPPVLVTPMWRAKSHNLFHATYHHGQTDTTTNTFIHKFMTSSFRTLWLNSASLNTFLHSYLRLARQPKSHPTACQTTQP